MGDGAGWKAAGRKPGGRRLATMAAAGLALLASMSALRAAEQDALPVPRFVSMKHGEINLRAGPGRRYPVDWVYKRREMPVEVISQFDIWRKIRDWQGTTGWVVEQAISGKRTFIVTGEIRALRGTPDENAALVARVEPGVIGQILECPHAAPEWCRVDVEGTRGWIRRGEFWGVYANETLP